MGSTATGANPKLVQLQLVVPLQSIAVQFGPGLFPVHRIGSEITSWQAYMQLSGRFSVRIQILVPVLAFSCLL